MDFMTGLPLSINWKNDICDSIQVIVDQITNIVQYELVKITINGLRPAKVIINVVVWHHGFWSSIVTNRAPFLSRNSDYCSATFLALSDNFLLPSIYKKTGKPNGKIAS